MLLPRPVLRRAAGVAGLVVLLSLGACAHGRAAPDDPGRPVDALIAQGETAAAAGDHLEAARAFDRALALDYARLQAHRGLIEAHWHLGRLAALEDRYRNGLEAEPSNAFHAYGLALTLYATSTARAEDALALLTRAESARPGVADFAYRRGVILLDAEQWAAAEAAFSQAVSLAPDTAQYRVPYALALFHGGRHDRSIEVLRGLLTLNPTPKEILKAREVAERINDPFQGVPDVARERVERAIAWIEQADVPQNAIDLLREVLVEYPETAMVHAILGLAYRRVDNGGEAVMHLRKAAELAPMLPQPHLYLAQMLQSLERFDDARAEFKAALDRNPLLVEAHRSLATMAVELGAGPEALEHLRAWALLEPDRAEPRLTLARVQAAAGDLEGARRSLDDALRIEPGNLEAHLSLGSVWVHRAQVAPAGPDRKAAAAEARAHLETVLEAQPDNAAAMRLLRALEE